MTSKTNITVDEDAIHWEEYLSEHGEKYRVGFLKEGNLQEAAKLDAEIPSKPSRRIPFDVEVNWPVHSMKSNFDSDFQMKTGISDYALTEFTVHNLYQYFLTFTNVEHYNYHFTDESRDRYLVTTYKNKQHSLQYNSRKPTIIRIQGK